MSYKKVCCQLRHIDFFQLKNKSTTRSFILLVLLWTKSLLMLVALLTRSLLLVVAMLTMSLLLLPVHVFRRFYKVILSTLPSWTILLQITITTTMKHNKWSERDTYLHGNYKNDLWLDFLTPFYHFNPDR